MQTQTTKLILGYKLATAILTQKAQQNAIAYNVNAHVAKLAQTGGLPCHNTTSQAVCLNILHNTNFNYLNLPLAFTNLYNYFNNLHLNVNFMVKVTPQPNLNYLMQA